MMKKKTLLAFSFILLFTLLLRISVHAQEIITEERIDEVPTKIEKPTLESKKTEPDTTSVQQIGDEDSEVFVDSQGYPIFDDKKLLEGYIRKYNNLSKEILLEMIKDDRLNQFKSAAAVRIFNKKYSNEVVSREKRVVEKVLWRRLKRTFSPYVQIEIMYALIKIDRYRYFHSMVPLLIQKLDHYNHIVNEISFDHLDDLTKNSNHRPREARIVFNTLRKVLFLSRKRLAEVTTPSEKLKRKLSLLRWSIKTLGNQELKRLPKEVISLL